MADFNGITGNENIIDLYNAIKSGRYKLSPDFQRKLVWNDKHKESFIETILKGFPFPEIYITDGEVDIENKITVKWIVDGQQRLSTIVQYIDDEGIKLTKIPKYSKLDDKERFLYYKVVTRNLGKIDTETIKEIFSRINSVNYALNAIEMKNALYDGEYISTAKEILNENEKFFSELDIFSDNEVSRMKDLEFVLTLMTIVESKGYFTTTSANEEYIKNYNEEYKNKTSIQTAFNNIFTFIVELDLDPYSIWLKKSNILTLIIELLRLKEKKYTFDVELFREILIKFENEILNNKTGNPEENDFAKYYYYALQGTGSKTSRIERGKILNRFFVEYLSK